MAKKSLIPCSFITTKGGKEVRLSYDQMRQFLFDNPEMWMSSSSRKIGVGKAQASLGGRGALSSVEATAEALEKSDLSQFPVFQKSKLSPKEVEKKIKNISDYDDVISMIQEAYGKEIPIYHASKNSELQKTGLKTVDAGNKKKYGESRGYYVQLGEGGYLSSERNNLYVGKIPLSFYSKYATIDTDSILTTEETTEILDFDISDLDTDTRDFIISVVSNNFNLDGIEIFIDEDLADGKDISTPVNKVTNKSVSEAYHAAKKDGSNPELVKAVEEALGKGKMQASVGGRGNAEIDKIIADAKANDTYLKAPNGKATSLNEFQWAQVRTKNFKNWFGDWENDPENASKIVDENGEPQVMYTGTSKDKDFDKFNVPQNGVWFTTDPEEASRYAIENDSKDYKYNYGTGIYEDKNTASRVIPAFLNIKRPEFFNKSVTPEQREKLRYANDYKKLQKQYFQDIYFRKPIGERTDGLYYSDDKNIVVVLEDPTQIKSAIGNTGVFSPVNPKLQASEGGRGELPGISDPNVRAAIIKAGAMYREAGNSKVAAISTGIKYLVDKGFTEADAKAIITPLVERLSVPTPSGSETSPAGWIAMDYIPREEREKINIARTTVENMKALGEMALRNNEVNPQQLTESFANGVSRPLSAVEVAALVFYKAQLTNKIEEAYKALSDAKRTGNQNQIGIEEANVANLERQLQNYYIASRKSAYEMGLAFRLRQMLLDQDYELIQVQQKYRAKYGPMPAETKAAFEELEKQRQELLEREKQLDADRDAFEREKTMAGLVYEVEEKKKGRDPAENNDKSFIVRKILNNIAKIPSIFSRSIKGQASAGQRGGDLSDGEYIWEQAVIMAADDLNKSSKPDKALKESAIQKGVEYIKSTKWYKGLSSDEQKEATAAYTAFMKANTKDPSISVTEDDKITISHKTLRDYTERVMEDNPMDKDDPDRYKKLMELVSKEILKDMAAELPLGTSWQDIRDAITKYGQTSEGSKEDLEVEIRNMKELGRKMAQLEAVLSGNKPLKSGYQRDPQSPEARQLVEQINEGLKKLALNEMESDAFLRSSLDKIKTSLKNQIEDLDRQIKAGKRTVKDKSKVVYDEEATALKELRDLLQKELDKIDPRNKKISAEAQLNNLIAGLELSILEYERRIKEKDFSAFKKVKTMIEGLPNTDKYKSLQKQRDDLKKQLADLKKGPQKSPLEKKVDDLQDEYDSLLDGTYQPKQPPVQYNDPRLKDLRSKIDALKTQLGYKKTSEDIKIEKLRKDLADLLAGNVRTRTAPSPDSPQATALRNQIQNLKDLRGDTARAELQRAIKAKRTQLEEIDKRIQKLRTTGQDVVGKAKIQSAIIDDIQLEIEGRREILKQLLEQHGITVQKLLAAEKKRLNKLIEAKEKRMREKNFGPKVSTTRRLTPDEYDQELRDIQVQKQLVYDRYEEEFYKAELVARPKWRKYLVDPILAVWDLPKSAVSGLDMSAPLRQGLFLVLSESPVKTFKAFRFMFEATFSNITDEAAVGKNYEDWMASIKSSPSYQILKASGLYLADQTTKGRAAEDAFANNLIHYIPFIEKPFMGLSLHLYKRSEIAYNAFLNYMRYSVFMDAVESLGALDNPITFQTHPEEFKAIAEGINIATGRPHLGRAEAAADIFNKVLFSVRLVLSRFIFLFTPVRAAFLPPAARKVELIRFGRAMSSLAAIMAMIALYYNNDDDDETSVELDPRGKFLNININENSSFNLTAGLTQWVSFLSKLLSGKYKKASTGEIRRLGESVYDPDALHVMAQFVAGKAAPTPRVLLEYAMAKPNPEEEGKMITSFGEDYNLYSSLGALAVPLIIPEALRAGEKNEILTAMGLGTAAFFGVTINVKSDKYKLPSQIMKEALDPTGKEYKTENEKAKIAIKDGSLATLGKIIEKQAPIYANYKMIANPDPELAKSMYAQSLLKAYQNDDLLQKTGMKTDDMRQMFFFNMAGAALPEIKESNTERKEKIEQMRNDLLEKFKSIPEPTRQNILGQYQKKSEELERVVALFNKLDLKYKDEKTGKYEKVKWDDFSSAFKWYRDFKYFYNLYPEFKANATGTNKLKSVKSVNLLD
jgi:hypothetical protein